MDDVTVIGAALLPVYLLWLWFLNGVRQNRLERRQYYDPRTGGPWIRPRARYEDLSH